MAEESSRWRRWRRRLGRIWRVTKWTFGALLLVAIVAIVWINVAGEAARRDILAELEAKGLATEFPLRIRLDWETKSADDGTRFALAALALSRLPDGQTQGVPIVSATEAPPRGVAAPDEMAVRLAQFAQDTQAFRAMLQRVREHDEFDYDMRWWRPGGSPVDRLGELRMAARNVLALSLHEQAQGRPDQAMAMYAHLAHLNRSFGNESWHIVTMMRRSVSAILVGAVEDALSRTSASDEAIVRLQDAIAADFASIEAGRVIETEMALVAANLRNLDAMMAKQVYDALAFMAVVGEQISDLEDEMPHIPVREEMGWSSPRRLKLQLRLVQVVYVVVPGLWKQWLANELRNAVRAYEAVQQAGNDPRQLALLGSAPGCDDASLIDVAGILQMWVGQRALVDVAITALAVERFRLANGHWPQRLDAAVSEVPIDPYTDAPLRYRRVAGGVVIYSVGINGADDGGEQEMIFVRDADIAFRLYDVDVRGTAPMPVQEEAEAPVEDR